MDVTRRPAAARRTRAVRHRARARNVLPPIQLGPSGQALSVTDMVVSAIVLAVALTAIRIGYQRVTGDQTPLLKIAPRGA